MTLVMKYWRNNHLKSENRMAKAGNPPGCLALAFLLLLTTTTTSVFSEASTILKDETGEVTLELKLTENNEVQAQLIRDGQVKLSGTIGKQQSLKELKCKEESTFCALGNGLSITAVRNGFNLTWSSENVDQTFTDCFNLNSATSNWYGGPQRFYQIWPLEKMTIDGTDPYVIKRADNFGVAERYWLSSNGTYVWLADHNPLWIDQNNLNPDQVCFTAQAKTPYVNRWRVVLTYVLVTFDDPKTAHLDAINRYLGKPLRHPDEKMIKEPVWTTWAKYKKPIDDGTVLEFGNDIRSHGYEGGQLEIDDNWERCYGSQEFDSSKFGDVENTVKKLHDDNWRVTLWIHPFVNDDCQDNSEVGKQAGYFVRNPQNETKATWWNGDDAHQIDFTIPEAAQWWAARLTKLQQSPGIDSFKFDAGETDYMNQPPIYEDVENSPNILTQKYIETCADFGDNIEYRSSFRGQKYGEFIRMLDKDSTWGLDNGLATLITTLLQLNMNGYGMVLPDMIGGNGYYGNPTGELIVRWTQANTFMPSLQFSYLPWDYTDVVSFDIEAIVKNFVDLHAAYAPSIIKAMNKSIEEGHPVNAPIWWVDPTDVTALLTADEYLLGEDILVAPVIYEGATTRDVYLPKGRWKDGNTGTVYVGPIALNDYLAPIEILPYFIKQD